MERSKRISARIKRVKSRRKDRRTKELTTEVVVLNDESPYPFCVLPAHFFDRALNAAEKSRHTLFAIEAIDGHAVLEVEG